MLITTVDLAELLQVTDKTLVAWRRDGKGPKYVKYDEGRSSPVMYRKADVEEWIASRVRDPTKTDR